MDSDLRTCRACKKPIRWILTAKGKAMPCDPDAIRFNPGVGKEIFVATDGRVLRGQRCNFGQLEGFVSHFATCPEADMFRKSSMKKTQGSKEE